MPQFTRALNVFLHLATIWAASSTALIAAPPKAGESGKSANEAVINYRGTKLRLTHAVVYRIKEFDVPVTKILFSDRPIRTEPLKRAVPDEFSALELFADDCRAHVEFTLAENYLSVNYWTRGRSLGYGVKAFKSELKRTDKRVKGKLYMPAPEVIFDNEFFFTLRLDAPLTPAAVSPPTPKSKTPQAPTAKPQKGQLMAAQYPIPTGAKDVDVDRDSKQIEYVVADSVTDANATLIRNLAKLGWREDIDERFGGKNLKTTEFTLGGWRLESTVIRWGSGARVQIAGDGLHFQPAPSNK